MKFKVNTKKFLDAIRIAMRGASKTTNSQILEGILFEAKNGVLTLYSTDLRISLRCVLDAEVYSDGKFVLNSNIISEVAKKMQGEFCEVSIDEEKCVVKSGRSVLRFTPLLADEFPDFPTLVENASVTIPSNLFKELIQKSSISVSLDESRLIYTGIKFILGDGFITAVALDGYRISITSKETKDSDNKEFIIPSTTLYDVEKLVSDDSFVTIRKSDSHAIISFDNADIYTRLFEGDFFDYSKLISTNPTTVMKVNKRVLSDALDRSMIIAKGTLNMVRIDIKDTSANLFSSGSLGSTSDDIDVSKSGEDLIIAFNPRYLKDGISVFEDDFITMNMNGNTNACLINSDKDKDFKYIVLPVRLQE